MDSATQVDRELVACWTEEKAACSRRLSYLRDYCPFQREEEEVGDEGSELETTTTRPKAEPGHAEVRPVKTKLPFHSPESEAEFVKAIRSRYLLKVKDDFLFRHAYERNRARAAEPDGRR
ncbi:unnamed protein product [Miscanthus lutarioriparius]|uniref:Uncharacterized protein n=1 Tax=Miscanthus lutarioriparius TaxID=422564 RepID=A0A811MTN5_9POAL|nr:unnamed protein product [Miscanthus lutarioriparius]